MTRRRVAPRRIPVLAFALLLLATPPGCSVADAPRILFADAYAQVPGVCTFRGDHRRSGGAWGRCGRIRGTLQERWRFEVPMDTGHWGGAAGWTGQPAIIEWPARIRARMLPASFAGASGAPGGAPGGAPLREVLQASLNGRVYFLDLATGRETRPPLGPFNPVKGSVSVDPRGVPLLYVGDGLALRDAAGFRLYDLFTGRMLHFQRGIDPSAYRGWGAFDGSCLFDAWADAMLLGGENGMLYIVRLNSAVDAARGTVALRPQVWTYRYRMRGQQVLGIENSVAAYRNLAFFADNAGYLTAFDLQRLRPLWVRFVSDDTDASIVVDVEQGAPVLYTACEVDAQPGREGVAWLRKIRGTDGALLWERAYACRTVRGERPVNGGALATPALGGGDSRGLIFFPLAHCPRVGRGLLLGLDCATGRERWRRTLRAFPWSSPVLVRDSGGASFLVQGNFGGTLQLVRARSGRILASHQLDGNIEASPAVFDDMLVVATRARGVYGIRIR